MRASEVRTIRQQLLLRMDRALLRVLIPFKGSGITSDRVSKIRDASVGFVEASRNRLQVLASEQYRDAVGSDYLDPPELTRFDGDTWESSLKKVTVEFEEFSEEVFDKIAKKAEWWAQDAERGSLIDYANRDSRIKKWARIDPRPPTCPFCTLMISRGAIHRNKEAAHFPTGCTCVVVLVTDENNYEGKASVDKALEEYTKASRLAGSTDLNDVIAAMKHLRNEEG